VLEAEDVAELVHEDGQEVDPAGRGDGGAVRAGIDEPAPAVRVRVEADDRPVHLADRPGGEVGDIDGDRRKRRRIGARTDPDRSRCLEHGRHSLGRQRRVGDHRRRRSRSRQPRVVVQDRTVPVERAMVVPPVGFDRTTVNDSVDSRVLSPMIGTVNITCVTPAANVSVVVLAV
jgi:hypothetical protein